MAKVKSKYITSYTYDDYKLWQGDWELYNGIAVAMSPAPMRKHQSLASEIIYNIREQFDDCAQCEVLGEVDYKVSDDTVLRPDVVLTCDETNESYLVKAPEIIVEIISPSTAKRDEKYNKQGDFTIEEYMFEDTTCAISIDFEKVFRRFRV